MSFRQDIKQLWDVGLMQRLINDQILEALRQVVRQLDEMRKRLDALESER